MLLAHRIDIVDHQFLAARIPVHRRAEIGPIAAFDIGFELAVGMPLDHIGEALVGLATEGDFGDDNRWIGAEPVPLVVIAP